VPRPRNSYEADYAIHIVRRVPQSNHRCKLPGWWVRRRLSLGIEAVIECDLCGQHWEWTGEAWWMVPRLASQATSRPFFDDRISLSRVALDSTGPSFTRLHRAKLTP
jgi:hypothetical protein